MERPPAGQEERTRCRNPSPPPLAGEAGWGPARRDGGLRAGSYPPGPKARSGSQSTISGNSAIRTITTT